MWIKSSVDPDQLASSVGIFYISHFSYHFTFNYRIIEQ